MIFFYFLKNFRPRKAITQSTKIFGVRNDIPLQILTELLFYIRIFVHISLELKSETRKYRVLLVN